MIPEPEISNNRSLNLSFISRHFSANNENRNKYRNKLYNSSDFSLSFSDINYTDEIDKSKLSSNFSRESIQKELNILTEESN